VPLPKEAELFLGVGLRYVLLGFTGLVGFHAIPDLRRIPAGSESPGKHLSSFSPVKVSMDTLPVAKRTYLSLLDDPDSSQVLRKSGILAPKAAGCSFGAGFEACLINRLNSFLPMYLL